jgi:hypothetical protein
LSHGVQVIGKAWRATMRIVVGVGDLVERTGDGRKSRVLSARTIRRSGDIVCVLHLARGDEERGFLGWASKPLGRFSLFWPQNQWLGFHDLGLKTSSYGLVI